ncbi:MAG: hypothetical protein N3B18_07835 [Desulfobacterota bacterium]|nr:hypothetical protein [Thermodesulfobacteriota bacterium]
MEQKKEVVLKLDMNNTRDRNIYNAIMDFGKKHNIEDESEALKSFIVFLHFLGADIRALSEKIKQIK